MAKLGNICLGSKLRVVVGRDLGQSLHARNKEGGGGEVFAAALCVVIVCLLEDENDEGIRKKSKPGTG